jgi:polyhydroxyalkanoate synthase
MASPLKLLSKQLNEFRARAEVAAGNALDWAFLRGSLVQSGLTPYETLFTGDPMSLRYYPPPYEDAIPLPNGEMLTVKRKRHAVPLILVPPLGITTESFDLMPHRSLVRFFSARGYHVYMIDWGIPERRHATLRLKDYALDMFSEAITNVRKHSGVEEVSLMGWCMGGLLSLMYAGASGDTKIRNLITIASPIDFRSSGMPAMIGRIIQKPADLLRRYSPLRIEDLNPLSMHMPAWVTTLGFKLTDPIGSITTYWNLAKRLADREFVESHSTTADYLDHMLVYPVGVLQDMFVHALIDNQFANGIMSLGDTDADLSVIKADYLAFAGNTDHIVPIDVASKSVQLVGSESCEFRIAQGGHMGVILGSKAASEVWEPCAKWLDSRSDIAGVEHNQAKPSAASGTVKRMQSRHRAEDPTL